MHENLKFMSTTKLNRRYTQLKNSRIKELRQNSDSDITEFDEELTKLHGEIVRRREFKSKHPSKFYAYFEGKSYGPYASYVSALKKRKALESTLEP